jgi:pimeloyl-ACP methyl ester carboxylesterase
MRRLSPGRLASSLLTLLTLIAAPSALQAAEKSDKISFDTFDQVELVGDFYDSGRGTKAPTVLLVHKLGGERKQLTPLAEELQKQGFAVLNFDLRGHGDSTSVKPDFWKHPVNMSNITGSAKKPVTIDFKNFASRYYPHLVNDLAAAKYALEKKNNAKECNVGDLVLIGADDGATLLAIWMATEWERRRPVFNPTTGQFQLGEPEGKDIAAGVWLSMRGALGSAKKYVNVTPSRWFRTEKVSEKVAFCFFYGAQDTYSAGVAESCFNALKNNKRMLALSYLKPVPRIKLSGHDLLGKEINIEEAIAKKYLKDVVFEKRPSSVWTERDLKNNPLLLVPRDLLISKLGVPAP